MVVTGERESLLRSLKGYLQDLAESGVDELLFVQPAAPEKAAQASSAPRIAAGEPVAGASDDAPIAAPTAGAAAARFALEGNRRARLLLIASGEGFSGEAGGLLERIVIAMQLTREEICLASFAPCSGRELEELRGEAAAVVASVAPEVIVTFGDPAASLLLPGEGVVEKLRGKFHSFQGIATMPTLHPEAMLADETLKRDVWKDMQQVMRRLASPG